MTPSLLKASLTLTAAGLALLATASTAFAAPTLAHNKG
jgi:hypothetical protein